MFKKICMVGLLAVTMIGVTGCSNGESGSGGLSDALPSRGDLIKIEDLDWTVDEAINEYGNRYVAFSFTNNSPYDVVDFKIKFTLKEPMTDEQLTTIRNNLKGYDKELDSDEEIREQYFTGQETRLASPGETLSGSQCTYNNVIRGLYDLYHFNLTEPDIATIGYVDNGKLYMVYYDFKSQKYNEDPKSGMKAYDWNPSGFAKKLPKPEAPVGFSDYDDEEQYGFECFGVKKEYFETYVQKCKDAGFTVDADKSSMRYEAKNSDGNVLTVVYVADDERLGILIKKEETK